MLPLPAYTETGMGGNTA